MKRKTKWILGGALVAAAPLWQVAPGYLDKGKKAPFMHRNFAHRGLHTEDKSIPENSIEAFELAASKGYGIELDVQLSKDGRVVVFHDDTLNRVCGVDARVDEKTYEELSRLRLCDTDYTIPLFTEVLACIDGRGPLIVELKSGKRNKELCEKTCALLKEYRGAYCVESFDPTIVAWFRFHAPQIVRGHLQMAAKYYKGVPAVLGWMAANSLLNFICRPHFVAYQTGKRPFLVRLAEKMGAMSVVWTSHSPQNETGNDAVIFEFYEPEIRY